MNTNVSKKPKGDKKDDRPNLARFSVAVRKEMDPLVRYLAEWSDLNLSQICRRGFEEYVMLHKNALGEEFMKEWEKQKKRFGQGW